MNISVNQIDNFRAKYLERLTIKLEFSVVGFKNQIAEVAGNVRDTLSATIKNFPVIHEFVSRIAKRVVRLTELVNQ